MTVLFIDFRWVMIIGYILVKINYSFIESSTLFHREILGPKKD
jgi:hypothetical protein